MKYRVKSGPMDITVEASSMEEAIIKAIKKANPEMLAEIIKVTPNNGRAKYFATTNFVKV